LKIVTISDSPTIFSGLARVHRHVIDALVEKGHVVLPCGWFAYDSDQTERIRRGGEVEPVFYQSTQGPVRVLAVPKAGNMNEMYAAYDVVDMLKPDLVITIGDHWNFYYVRAVKIKADFSFKWLPYFTVEHDDVEDKWEALFRYADAILVPTEYGKRIVESCCDVETVMLPYGVDEKFRPLPKDDVRRIRERKGCSGKVRFITVAQNTWRKNLPALLQAVNLLKNMGLEDYVTFHLHTNVDAMDRQEGYLYDLRKIVSKMGLESLVTFPEGDETFSVFRAPKDEYMVEEYNASDFLICPSTTEGFSLPVVEAMACGLPVIANSASTMPEHLGGSVGDVGRTGRGFLVASDLQITPPSRFMRVVRPEDLAAKIMDAFRMTAGGREGLSRMKENCVKYGKERGWARTKDGLCEVVDRLAGKPKVVVEEF